MKRLKLLFLFSLFQFFTLVDAVAAENPLLQYRAGLDSIYTDNAIYVFNMANNTLTTTGDFVFEPYLTFIMKRRAALFSQKLIVYVSSDIFSRYSPLNYQTYSALFEQGIGNKAFLNLKYTLIPNLVLREEDISNTGQGSIDTGLNYRLQVFTLSLDKDFSQNYNFYIYGKNTLKTYSTPFVFRSAMGQTLGVDLTLRMDKQTTAIMGLAYEVNQSRKGFRTLVGFPAFNDDTDYTSPGIAFSVTHHVSPEDYFRLKVGFRKRHYTADLADPLHGGRDDQANNVAGTNYFKLTPGWTWKIGYEYFKWDSNKSYANYTVNSLTTGIDYLFK